MIIQNPLFTQEIPEKGAAKGHLRFVLRSRAPEDIALVGLCANLSASLLFEKLQAQGTNIIFKLEKDNSRVDVVARFEGDGLNFQWTPKPIEPQQLNEVQERIKNKTFFIGKAAEKTAEKTLEVTAKEKAPILTTKEPEIEIIDEDEQIKHLHRIP